MLSFLFLLNNSHDPPKSTCANWVVEDAHIHLRLYNRMEPEIGGTFVFSDTAKQVWQRAKEYYSWVNNLHWTFGLYQTYFSLGLGDSRILC